MSLCRSDRDGLIVALGPYYAAMCPEEGLACGVSYRDALRIFAERHDRVRILGYPDMERYLDAEVARHRMPYSHQVYRLASGRWIEARKVPLPGDRIAGRWRDITLQREAEAIGSAHVLTPATNAQPLCTPLL